MLPNFTRRRVAAKITRKWRVVKKIVSFRGSIFRSGQWDAVHNQLCDLDAFDRQQHCYHMFVQKSQVGVVACLRCFLYENGQELTACYTSSYFSIEHWCSYPGRLLELGRLCVHPEHGTSMMAIITQFSRRKRVKVWFGVSNFSLDSITAEQAVALAFLMKHRAVEGELTFRPKLARERWFFAGEIPPEYTFAQAVKQLPPALAWYIGRLNGRVSDHAVVDQDLRTIVVGTLVKLDELPEQQLQRLLVL